MKNRKAILLLFLANTVSGCAEGITMISIPAYFATINKEALFGKIFFGVTFVSLFWGFLAGSLIDKYDRKKIFLTYNAAAMLIVGAISAYGYYMDGLPEYLVAAVFATTVFLYNIHFPSYYAFAQEITEKHLYTRISSWLEIQNQFMFVLSGAIGAILLVGTENGELNIFGFKRNVGFDLAPWNIWDIFLVDGFTYLFAIIVLSFITYESLHDRQPDGDPLIQRIIFGFKYLKANPGIMVFGIGSYMLFATILVLNFYLMPIYIERFLGEGQDIYANSEMYFAMGSLLSGFIVGKLFRNVNYVLGIIILCSICAGIYFFMFLNKSLALFFPVIFLLGLSNASVRILRITYLFRLIPNDVIGRTGSIFNMVNVCLRLLFTGLLLFPFFQAESNIVYGMLIFSVAVVVAIITLVYFYFRMRHSIEIS